MATGNILYTTSSTNLQTGDNIQASFFKLVTSVQLDDANGNVSTTGNLTTSRSLGVGTIGSGVDGEIRATNNITAFYSSDRQLKENIKDIPNALAAVEHIGGKLFDWKDDYINARGGEDGYFVQKSDFGVIAQDVQEVFPLAVRIKSDGTLAVDYEKLCVLAFAAIKELKMIVDGLSVKNKIT